MKEIYFETITQIERLHRVFLDVVNNELCKLNILDINNVQAIILYNIGNDQITVGELTQRGYYMGSNVSYNLRKLVTNGYISQLPSQHDKRSTYIKASAQGLSLYKNLEKLFESHAKNLSDYAFNGKGFETLSSDLKKIELFWKNLSFR